MHSSCILDSVANLFVCLCRKCSEVSYSILSQGLRSSSRFLDLKLYLVKHVLVILQTGLIRFSFGPEELSMFVYEPLDTTLYVILGFLVLTLYYFLVLIL